MRRSLLLLGFILIGISSIAQDADNDWSVWKDTNAPDTLRLLGLSDHILKMIRTDPDSCETLATIMVNHAKEKGLIKEQVIGLRWLARSYDARGQSLESLQTLEEAKAIAESSNDIKLHGTVYNSLGIVHRSLGNYSISIEYFLKGLAIDEQLDHPLKMSQSYRNVGMVFADIKDHDKAEEYYLKGLKLVDDHGFVRSKPFFYSSLGNLSRDKGDPDAALEYYRKIIEMGDEVENQMLIGASYHNIALTYWKDKDSLETALKNFTKALSEKERIGWASAYSTTYNGLGGVNNHLGNYEVGMAWCRKSLQDSRKNRKLVAEKSACGCLYESFKGMGQLDSALRYHELLEVINDSLMNIDREKEVNRKELGYQFEKRAMADSIRFESEQALLVERNQRQKLGLFGVAGGLILVLALAYSIYIGKNKSDELLLNILPYETAQELKQKGHADAKLIDDVTVIFTDFKGFTAMSETLSPKDLVEDLNTCFSEFDRIMDKYGIEKIKTIGDAYMAACGLPSPDTDHATKAVNAALEMRDFVAQGKQRKLDAGLPYFEIRIGIHTGPVVAGIVGIKKFQYDIWGDTVNTASRMESSGEVGKVNASRTTFDLVNANFATEHRGKVEAKGKGAIDMYFIEPLGATKS